MGAESAPPRALVVSRNLPPLTGGMERLNLHAYRALLKQYSVAVCGPTGTRRFLEPGSFCSEAKPSPLSRFLTACQWRSWKLARSFRPQLVYSGSGLTAPAALMAARSVGATSVCFLHGLDIVADHPVYRGLFLPAVRKFDRILVNSRHTAGLASAAGIDPDRVTVVHPGVDIPDASERSAARMAFRERLGLGDRPLLLAAGRLTKRKGLDPFIRESLPDIIRHHPTVTLLVIGQEPSEALQHRRGVATEIEEAARVTGLAPHILLLGHVTDAVLSQAYFAADLFIFPVLETPGDVEGFGMVAIEAAAHGLQTVAFKVGGVADSVAHDISGWLIEPGDYASMTLAVVDALDSNETSNSADRAEQLHWYADGFHWEAFESRFLKALPPKKSDC